LAEIVYHVEMRQFPHNMCRFNLSAQELRAAVLGPWVGDRLVEFGERKWNPEQAKLTVLEGPPIPVAQLSMGRGWRTAERRGRDVTEELLAALRQEPGRAAVAAASGVRAASAVGRPAGSQLGERAGDPVADSLGLELLARVGAEPAPLRVAWELAVERHPGSPASATLALAERALESLLRARLIVLRRFEGAAADARGGEPMADLRAVGEEQVGQVFAEIASWHGTGAAGAIWMRRA
jgi:hypothetical protein